MSTNANALIDFRRAGMAFNSHTVLRDINLGVPAGQTVAVVGESGCGKTVALKLIVGLLRPTAGQALFDGKQIADLSDQALVNQRLRIGFLFQGAALFDSLTVYDNVAFGLRAKRKIGEALAKPKEMMESPATKIGRPRQIYVGPTKRPYVPVDERG